MGGFSSRYIKHNKFSIIKTILGFLWWPVVKNPPSNVGDLGSISGLENESPPCCWATKPVQHNYWACTLQQEKPKHCNKDASQPKYQPTKQTKIQNQQTKKQYHIGMSFPGGTHGKEFACNAGDLRNVGLISGLGRSSGVGNGNAL